MVEKEGKTLNRALKNEKQMSFLYWKFEKDSVRSDKKQKMTASISRKSETRINQRIPK